MPRNKGFDLRTYKNIKFLVPSYNKSYMKIIKELSDEYGMLEIVYLGSLSLIEKFSQYQTDITGNFQCELKKG